MSDSAESVPVPLASAADVDAMTIDAQTHSALLDNSMDLAGAFAPDSDVECADPVKVPASPSSSTDSEPEGEGELDVSMDQPEADGEETDDGPDEAVAEDDQPLANLGAKASKQSSEKKSKKKRSIKAANQTKKEKANKKKGKTAGAAGHAAVGVQSQSHSAPPKAPHRRKALTQKEIRLQQSDSIRFRILQSKPEIVQRRRQARLSQLAESSDASRRWPFQDLRNSYLFANSVQAREFNHQLHLVPQRNQASADEAPHPSPEPAIDEQVAMEVNEGEIAASAERELSHKATAAPAISPAAASEVISAVQPMNLPESEFDDDSTSLKHFTSYRPLFHTGSRVMVKDPQDNQMRIGEIVRYSPKRDVYLVKFPRESPDADTGAFRALYIEPHHKTYSFWIDFKTQPHMWEFVDLIWANTEPWGYWPCEAIKEYKFGKAIVTQPGKVAVYWTFTSESEPYYMPLNKTAPWKIGLKHYEAIKDTRKGSKTLTAATEYAIGLFDRYVRYWMQVEHAKRVWQCEVARSQSIDPAEYLGRRVSVYWELDEAWYTGVAKQYNNETGQHFILYDDGAVEWVDAQFTHYLSFAATPLNLDADAAVPQAHAELKAFYHDYREFIDHNTPNLSKPYDRQWAGAMPLLDPPTKLTEGTANNVTAAHLKSSRLLSCWECGEIDWDSDALALSGNNKKSTVVQCVRCSKNCHRKCYDLMLQRLPQGVHVDPSMPRCSDCLKCEHCGLFEHPNAENAKAAPPVDTPTELRNALDLVSCEVCDVRVHAQCCDPPLQFRPQGSWICARCLVCRSCGQVEKPKNRQKATEQTASEESGAAAAQVGLARSNSNVSEMTTDEANQAAPAAEPAPIPNPAPAPAAAPEVKRRKPGRPPNQPPRGRGRPRKSEQLNRRVSTDAAGEAPESGPDNEAPEPAEVSISSPPPSAYDRNFWEEWRYYYFLQCGECSRRMKLREYCPICLLIWGVGEDVPMVECGKCERWVHIRCDASAQSVDDELLNKESVEYNCPECVKREKSTEMIEIMDDLSALDRFGVFAQPVTEDTAPDYFKTIRTPMDFSTIYKKLSELQYSNLDQFKYDLNLVWRNAKDYNAPSTSIHRLAVRLQQRSMQLFAQLAARHEANSLQIQEGRIEDKEEKKKEKKEKKNVENSESAGNGAAASPEIRLIELRSEVDQLRYFTHLSEYYLCDYDCCALCGSFGDWRLLLNCVDCGECYHWFCLNPLDQRLSEERVNAERLNGHWRCPNCRFCPKCVAPFRLDVLNYKRCQSCDTQWHLHCLPKGSQAIDMPLDRCQACTVCRFCGADKPGKAADSEWKMDFSACEKCAAAYEKGAICPICEKFWSGETDAIGCDRCGKWLHLDCAEITAEDYEELGQDPTYKYYCAKCCHKNRKLESITADTLQRMRKSRGAKQGNPDTALMLARSHSASLHLSEELAQFYDRISPFSAFHNPDAIRPLYALSDLAAFEQIKNMVRRIQFMRRRKARRIQLNLQRMGNAQRAIIFEDQEEQEIHQTIAQLIAFRPLSTAPPPKPLLGPVKERQWMAEDSTVSSSAPIKPFKRSSQPRAWQLPNRYAPPPQSNPTRHLPALSAAYPVDELPYSEDPVDRRFCCICNVLGDLDVPPSAEPERFIEGRLLPADGLSQRSRWVHVQCAVWAHQHHLTDRGIIVSVFQSALQAATAQCELCNRMGAALKCSAGKCKRRFHYPCARRSGCAMFDDTRVYCPEHAESGRKSKAGRLIEEVIKNRMPHVLKQTLEGGSLKQLIEKGPTNMEQREKIFNRAKNKRKRISKGAANKKRKSAVKSEEKNEEMGEAATGAAAASQDANAEDAKEDRVKEEGEDADEDEFQEAEAEEGADIKLPELTLAAAVSAPPPVPTNLRAFIRLGALTVLSVGDFSSVPDSSLTHFHSSRSLYPPHYSACRMFWSYLQAWKRVKYSMEIRIRELPAQSAEGHSELRPSFVILASDDPSSPIEGNTAAEAFVALIKRFPSFLERNSRRRRLATGEFACFGLTGEHFFGFGHPRIREAIEVCATAVERCTLFWSQRAPQEVDSDSEEAKLAELESAEPVLPNLVIPFNSEGCARAHAYTERKDWRPFNIYVQGLIAEEKAKIRMRKLAIAQNGARRKAGPLANGRLALSAQAQYRAMKETPPLVRVAHSPIHEWGLFASEPIEEGTFVIEYLGELIRQAVADLREVFYERNGLDSTYMFKIDDDQIVDGTKKGNMSRFINHSCDPNCVTKIVDVSGVKKIVVVANRSIAINEEITYDYFFANEDDRIACRCGSINCAGRLN